jgi:hypothetical protein
VIATNAVTLVFLQTDGKLTMQLCNCEINRSDELALSSQKITSAFPKVNYDPRPLIRTRENTNNKIESTTTRNTQFYYFFTRPNPILHLKHLTSSIGEKTRQENDNAKDQRIQRPLTACDAFSDSLRCFLSLNNNERFSLFA